MPGTQVAALARHQERPSSEGAQPTSQSALQVMEMMARHPGGEKAAAGGGQDSRSSMQGEPPVAQRHPRPQRGACSSASPTRLGKARSGSPRKLSLCQSWGIKIHAGGSEKKKIGKRRKATAAGQTCRSPRREAHRGHRPASPPPAVSRGGREGLAFHRSFPRPSAVPGAGKRSALCRRPCLCVSVCVPRPL